MNTHLYLWGWLILAIIFFVGEMLTAGFFLMAFGIGAALAAVAAFLGLDILWQLGIFVAGSAVALLLSRRFAETVTPKEPPARVGIDRVLGQHAVIIEPIDVLHSTGIVRVNAEEWRAIPEDPSQVIPEKQIVQVVAVDGTRLVVRPLDTPTPS